MFCKTGFMLCGALLIPSYAFAAPMRTVALSSLNLKLADQGWGKPGLDVSVGGKLLSSGGKAWASGWGTHARSTLSIRLNGARRFQAQVGLDDEEGGKGSVVFSLEKRGQDVMDERIM